MKLSLHKVLLRGVILLSLSSCNGLFDDLYDDPITENDKSGYIKYDSITRRGQIYVDATSYLHWAYIDLRTLQIDTSRVQNETQPNSWDFAVHRYEAKTNGGEVIETKFSTLEELLGSGSMPDGAFVKDQIGDVAVDMSDMINDNIIYHTCLVNHELSKWLDVDISIMPPIYTPSEKVYIIRLNDGSCAAMRLADFRNESLVKGFLTIDYIYPLEFD